VEKGGPIGPRTFLSGKTEGRMLLNQKGGVLNKEGRIGRRRMRRYAGFLEAGSKIGRKQEAICQDRLEQRTRPEGGGRGGILFQVNRCELGNAGATVALATIHGAFPFAIALLLHGAVIGHGPCFMTATGFAALGGHDRGYGWE